MTVKGEDGNDALFEDIDAAEQFVTARGIDRIYKQQAAPNTLPGWMNA